MEPNPRGPARSPMTWLRNFRFPALLSSDVPCRGRSMHWPVIWIRSSGPIESSGQLSIRTELLALQGRIQEQPSNLGPWLVCDTDTLATVAWWERYLTTSSSPLLEFAQSRLADLYVVTSPNGVAFDDSDPTRDGRHVRLAMHERFCELVAQSGRPYIVVSGDRSERVHKVRTALTEFEAQHPRFVP